MFGVKILEEKKSKYNGQIRVVKSLGFGTYIQANGLTQSGGIVESIWRSTLKKIGNKQISNCLILGLGGGTLAKLIKKDHPSAKITGIDIDPVMVELGKKYLGLDQVKVNIRIGDALKEIQKPEIKDQKFDLIIVDLYQGDKFPEKFTTEQYLRLVRSLLSSTGIAVFNRLYYGVKRPLAVKFGKKLEKVFPKVMWYYPEANLMLVCTT